MRDHIGLGRIGIASALAAIAVSEPIDDVPMRGPGQKNYGTGRRPPPAPPPSENDSRQVRRAREREMRKRC